MTVVYSTQDTLLGAAVGAAFGYLVAQYDESRNKAMWPGSKALYVGAGTAVFAVIGAYIGRGLGAKPNYAALPPDTVLPPGALNVADTGTFVATLVPGIQTVSQTLPVSTVVILHLPAGGKWVSFDGAPIGDKTSPQAFVFNGPISHTLVWTDVTNTTQSTTVILSVQTPTTTT